MLYSNHKHVYQKPIIYLNQLNFRSYYQVIVIYISKIIIVDAHESVLHSRVDSTLNRVRSRFWIIRGRQTVKEVIKPCVLCKWFQGYTLKPRPIADLP